MNFLLMNREHLVGVWLAHGCSSTISFKVQVKNVFFFVLEIFTYLYYANEESNDVISASTKMAQHSIKNISRNIEADSVLYLVPEEPRVLTWQKHSRCLSVSFF